MNRRFYRRLIAGITVLIACAVVAWCFQQGLLDPSSHEGSRFLIVFATIAGSWAFFFAIGLFAFRKKQPKQEP
jgi:hypothetical protein